MAEMVLSPGQSTGGAENRHASADQWLYVVEGEGDVVVEGKSVQVKAGEILLIEKGETHEVRNMGEKELKTLNWYSPAEY